MYYGWKQKCTWFKDKYNYVAGCNKYRVKYNESIKYCPYCLRKIRILN